MQNKGLTFRAMDISDYDDLTALWQLAGLPYRPRGRDSRPEIARELQRGRSVFLLAEDQGKLIASVIASHDGRKGWINRLAVLPSYRRQGIATLIVQEAEHLLLNQGIGIIACLIEDWNQLSVNFFGKLGYEHHPEIGYFTKKIHPDI